MPEKTFYDEIVECLRLTRRNTPAVTVSEDVLKDFMTDLPRKPAAALRPEADPFAPSPVRTPPPAARPVPQVSPAADPAKVAAMNWDELAAAVASLSLIHI